MAETSENRLDDIHRAMLRAIEENADPVATSRAIRDNEAIDISKPTMLKRLDQLEEWGKIERENVGRAYAIWPTGKYDELYNRLDELERDRDYYQRRAAELEEERDDLEERLREVESKLSRFEDGRPKPVQPSRFLVPERHPDISEEKDRLWRERITSWGRNVLGGSGLAGVILVVGLLIATYADFVQGVFAAIGVAGANLDYIFVPLIFLWLLFLTLASLSFIGVVLGLLALRSPTVARWGEKLVWVQQRIGGVDSDTDD